MLPQIGDFIAIASLATRAFNALDSARGSKFEFTSLLNSLKALSQAMLRAEALCMECHTTSFDAYKDPRRIDLLNAVASDISKERKECEALVSHFLKSFEPYHTSFAESHTKKINQGFKKLTWIWRKEEAAMLEQRLSGHVQAMQLHLWTFYHATTSGDMANDRATLGSIESSVRLAMAGVGDVQHKMSEALVKLDTVQKAMPPVLGHFWGPERPVLLLDGLGRKTFLPMMLVCSPEIFRDVLLIMHRNCPGYDKIESGKYVVSDEDSGGALVPREKWLDFLQPGKFIGLSFLMKHPGARDEKQCPRCRSLKTWLDDHPGQRRCLKCHLTYKIEDQERTRRYWKDLKVRPKPPKPPDDPSSSPSKSPKKPKGEDDEEDYIKRPPKKQGTLDPEDYDHPYLRVHYQRDVPSRGAVEQPWKKTDPEFEKFLAALPLIHRAAATGNVEKLDELLGDGEDGDAHWEVTDSLFRHDRTGWDFAGAPPIHFAAYYGHTQAVLFLLSWEVDIDGKDAAGTTALHAAAWTGNEKLFKLLLRKGADKTICDSDGWSATIYATSQGHDNIPRLLLEDSEGDVETLVKMSKLRHAAKLGNMEVVLEMLLEDQATTVREEDSETRDMLLGEALIGAAEGGHEELARRLLDSGADPTATDGSGSTAIHWASWGGHTEIENQRYDQDGNSPSPTSPTFTPPPPYSDSDTHTDSAELTPTPATPTTRAFGHEAVIAILMERGADINAQNSQGCTALHWVSGAGSRGMVRWLVELGADVAARDGGGRRAMERARETGDEVVINILEGRCGGEGGGKD